MPSSDAPPRTIGNSTLIRLLDTVGDGSGSVDMSLNFTTPTMFKITPPKGTIYYIAEIAVSFVAGGGIAAGGYGSGTALTNGLQFEAFINGQIISIPQLQMITSNFELILATNTFGQIPFQGNSTGIKSRLNFDALGLLPIQFSGNTGDELRLTLEDDFTTRVTTGEQSVSIYGSSFTS